MEINELSKTLATSLGVDEAKATEVISSLKINIFTDDEKSQFENNVKKIGYESGKVAEKEMTLKNLKKAKGLEIEANSIDELFDKYADSVKSNFSGDTDVKLKEKDETILKLQKTIQETENEKNQIKTEFSQKLKETKSNTLLNSEIAKIKVEIPEQVRVLGDKAIEKYIDAKLEQHSLLFKSKFKIDFDENENPIFKDSQGNILVDKTQSPLKINEVVQMFAKDNWLDISATSQRQGRDGQNSGKTSGDNLKGMTETELVKYCADNGILKNSKAHDEVYLKWKTANK